jgi:glycine/D-amino acid oxidase-like deaminating enzyme
MVPRAEQHREIGSDFYHGGRMTPNDARLHPGLYHQGLLDRVTNAGAAIAANTPVTRIERDGDEFRVHTPCGAVTARDVVVGTNGYTGGAVPFLERRMIPVRSQMIATEPLPEALMARLMPQGRLINDTKRTRNYYRPSPDGKRILMGGRPTLRDAPLEVSARHLRDFLVRVFPELAETRITHSWDGKLGFTFDQLPHIGVHDGIHYAGGYLGSGVAMATYLGHKMGLRVLGSPEARTPLDDRYFPTMPFYRGKPWFLATIAAYYRLRDSIG